jgi:ParB-like chromosome segregation protein Spo0J
MKKVFDLGNGISLWQAHVDEFREQDVNARVMSKEKFDRLKKNIEQDSRMESLPLAHMITNPSGNDQLAIISGHHRIRAARMAAVTEIYSLVIDEELTDDQVKAKQLAHNALNGQDDPQLLKVIYDQIQDIQAKIESGVIEEEMNKIYKQVHIDEVSFDFKYELVKIMFLETQFKQFEKAARLIEKDEIVMLAAYMDFDIVAEAIRKVSSVDNIRNIAAIMYKMATIILEHYGTKAEV